MSLKISVRYYLYKPPKKMGAGEKEFTCTPIFFYTILQNSLSKNRRFCRTVSFYLHQFGKLCVKQRK